MNFEFGVVHKRTFYFKPRSQAHGYISPTMKLSFTLNKPKQPVSTPSIGPSAVFASEGDDDPAPSSAFADPNATGNKKLHTHDIVSSREKRKRTEAEEIAEVYDYDGAWDSIQAERQRQREAKDSEARERKVSFPTRPVFTVLIKFIISPGIYMVSYLPLQHGNWIIYVQKKR